MHAVDLSEGKDRIMSRPQPRSSFAHSLSKRPTTQDSRRAKGFRACVFKGQTYDELRPSCMRASGAKTHAPSPECIRVSHTNIYPAPSIYMPV